MPHFFIFLFFLELYSFALTLIESGTDDISISVGSIIAPEGLDMIVHVVICTPIVHRVPDTFCSFFAGRLSLIFLFFSPVINTVF